MLYNYRGVNCCCCGCLVAQSRLTLATPWTISPPDLLFHAISRARLLEWLPFPSPGDLPNPGIEPMSPELSGRVFTAEPSGKPILSPKYLGLNLN